MYAERSAQKASLLYQGDIIDGLPFYILGDVKSVIQNDQGYYIEQASIIANNDVTLHIVEAKKRRVMVLSQTCDAQRRENIIICPVYTLSELVETGAIGKGKLESVRGRKVNYWFYLPPEGDFPESIADFQTMLFVPRLSMDSFIDKKIISLNDFGRHHLAWGLAGYFGRPTEEQI